MDHNDKAELEHRIRQKLKKIEVDIAAFELLAKPVPPDSAIGRLTRMEAINSKSINEAALEKARTTRARLEEALENIDDPDFGICRECEEPIPPARLMILPETDVCVRCAQKLGG